MRTRVASPLPLAKVSVGALAGALVAILAYLLRTYAAIDLPSDVQSALIIVISAGASYLMPLLPHEIAIDEDV